MINQPLVLGLCRILLSNINSILFTKFTENLDTAVRNRNVHLLPLSAYFSSNFLKSERENILAYKLTHWLIKAVSVTDSGVRQVRKSDWKIESINELSSSVDLTRTATLIQTALIQWVRSIE